MSKSVKKVNITYALEGEDAERFLDYKKKEFLKNTAEAARKLMLERLHQVTIIHKPSRTPRPKPDFVNGDS